ncbi:Cof-type HAD-IIB family hydrolase [Corynebacterium tapiri]|uniref:Cof-type HAD-IIB family hydrolase n=1 Tax=Corynebacterium tapiri TaxID=1448266 RepID=UPI001FE911E2|nr:Cof-type HAD-IIB family hydrolase [Corynebacterium tapiri]
MTTLDELTSGWRPRLIASDVDGTLINSAERVIPRLAQSIERAVDEGCEVALATGRPFRWIQMVLDQLPVQPVCVTSNGAVLYDSADDTVLEAHQLQPAAMAHAFEVANDLFTDRGGVSLACERLDGFYVAPDYFHTWEEQGFEVLGAAEVVAEPAVKMILRNVDMTAPEMYEALAPLIDADSLHLTYSINAGLLELAAPGVTKALGVQALCRLHGVDISQVVAFGDMPNDIEMLRAARLGVAMGNADPRVTENADYVTATNDEGGVADVLERWF